MSIFATLDRVRKIWRGRVFKSIIKDYEGANDRYVNIMRRVFVERGVETLENMNDVLFDEGKLLEVIKEREQDKRIVDAKPLMPRKDMSAEEKEIFKHEFDIVRDGYEEGKIIDRLLEDKIIDHIKEDQYARVNEEFLSFFRDIYDRSRA